MMYYSLASIICFSITQSSAFSLYLGILIEPARMSALLILTARTRFSTFDFQEGFQSYSNANIAKADYHDYENESRPAWASD